MKLRRERKQERDSVPFCLDVTSVKNYGESKRRAQ
jgi:hypothetical protein